MIRRFFNRTIFFLVSLIASVFVPYAWWNEDWREALTSVYKSWTSQSGSTAWDGNVEPTAFLPGWETPSNAWMTTSAEGSQTYGAEGADAATRVMPSVDVGQVIRFDVTPDWVVQRWPRVSSVAADGNLKGLRVPLVTGTQTDSVAGSLTYFFSPSGQVQRITLIATTGDARPLIDIATQQYGLRSEAGPASGLYVARWNGEPMSVLEIRQAPVIRFDALQTRWQVLMEINRPAIGYQLSPQVRAMLAHRI